MNKSSMMARWAGCWLAASLLTALVPSAAAAQRSPPACRPGERVEGDVGIEGISCRNCSLRGGDGAAPVWRFRSEPEVLSVREGSPAVGKIRAGDVITAVDDVLITTAEGGRRLASLEVGQAVTLTIRRGAKISRVTLVAERRCREPSPPPPEFPRSTFTPVAPLAPTIALEDALMPGLPPQIDLWPSGWVGFGISCRCSIRAGEPGDPALWSFREAPEIYSVEPGSPAALAGLERGDVLLEVDGVSLTSEEGGRRFGAIRAGETVRFKYRRGERTGTVSMTAQPRLLATLPDSPQLAAEAWAQLLDRNQRELQAQLELSRHLAEQAAQRDSADIETLLREARIQEEHEQVRAAELYSRLLERSLSSGSSLGQYMNLNMNLAPYLGLEHVRFAGNVGDVDVEVRGPGSVMVTVVEEGKEIVIIAGDARITLKTQK